MTPPLLDHLCSFKDTHITIGSNLIEDAKKLCARNPEFISAEFLDVFNVSNFSSLFTDDILGVTSRSNDFKE
jgi:hypothetical protein